VQNGNYPDPSLTSSLPLKRQHRDPYADWWDPIERRNYGEPVHEDNDILGVFSTEDYTHFSAARGGFLWVCINLAALCSMNYADSSCVAMYNRSVWGVMWSGLQVLSRQGKSNLAVKS
jgi:hypothetical protein